MSRLGLQVERPIAHGEHRSCGLFHEGFIITEVPIHAESLDTAAMRHCTARGIPEIDRRRFLEALGAAVGRMHCAGVQHGSLFAGNILVSETSDGGWRFTFTRPGRRARSFDQSVPYGGVIADLAELAASGAGFGRFQDVALFMRAYRRAMAGAKLDKRVVRDVLAAAGSRIVPTGCELALTEALRWVQRRVNAESAGGRARSMRTFASIDSFLEAVVSVEAPPLPSNKSETIGFTLSARGRDAPPRRFLLRMTERGIAIHPGCDGEAELCIETDDDAWLSVVNAAAIAPQTIRNHRIRIRGNMERLRALLALVQAIQRSSSSSAHGSEATE